MATYFPTSSNQRGTGPMLYLSEPMPNSYSETPNLSANMMMMYMNYPTSSGSYTDTLLAANSHQQNSSIDIPPLADSNSNASQQRFLSNLEETQIGDQDFNAWRDNSRSDMLLMQPMGGPGPTSILETSQNLQGQGLSLSLSTQIPSGIQIPSLQYQNPNSGFSSLLSPNNSPASGKASYRSFRDDENFQSKQSRNDECMKLDASQFGMSSISITIPGSKYLKAAQQLLNEVVNVHKAMKQDDSKKELRKDSKETETSVPSNPQEPTTNSPTELSAAEKQDLQNKMTKLLSMLDAVDRRYKQYYRQMQSVVSSFDVVAGCGSAMPYTALALQTISRHFRCLRDAINGQIQSTQQSLGGEQDGSANIKGVGISRLRYVDQQLRQQRALHHLGVMPQHTWRPQRGLPESSVTILRAWLFEHFLHPYPKDSDKIMLARQTGLMRSQVSNWFINARVRLWKPMVEEMYKEEAGDVEMDSNSSSEVSPKLTKGDIRAFEEGGDNLLQSTTSNVTNHFTAGQCIEPKSDHPRDEEMMRPGTYSSFQNVTPVQTRSHYETIVESNESGERFITDADAACHMSELARFGNGSGVSLTLGLQHCEDGNSVPMSLGSHHSYVIVREDDVYDSSVGPEGADFGCMDTRNRQQRFGSSNLLDDFVA